MKTVRAEEAQRTRLTSFYDPVVASAIFYGVVCWSSSISAADRRRLEKLKASSNLGCPLDPVQVVGDVLLILYYIMFICTYLYCISYLFNYIVYFCYWFCLLKYSVVLLLGQTNFTSCGPQKDF